MQILDTSENLSQTENLEITMSYKKNFVVILLGGLIS